MKFFVYGLLSGRESGQSETAYANLPNKPSPEARLDESGGWNVIGERFLVPAHSQGHPIAGKPRFQYGSTVAEIEAQLEVLFTEVPGVPEPHYPYRTTCQQ